MPDGATDFAAVSSDGLLAVEWEPADEEDGRDGWLLWKGYAPGWLGPKPYRWRDDLIQRATLVFKEYDTSKTAEQVLRDHDAAIAARKQRLTHPK